MNEEVRISPDRNALTEAAASYLRDRIHSLLTEQGFISLVLAGGSTPRRLYERLASGVALPWDRIHLFLGDERFVPADDPESNFGMIRRSLLQHITIPAQNLHFYDTRVDSPEECARDYASELKQFSGGRPRFDLVLLGMGADGHTLSVFPGAGTVDASKMVVAATAPPSYQTRERVTLTVPLVNEAREAVFLVAGADKSEAFARVRPDAPERDSLPAGRVRPRERLIWFVDETVAG